MAQIEFASESVRSASSIRAQSDASSSKHNMNPDRLTGGSRPVGASQISGADGEQPISTVERIARNLADRIIFGELKSSERIQELKIAGELKVSRGSVREALLVLEGRHMVSILPRRGALVRPLNNNEIASISQVIAQVTGTLFAEFSARRPTGTSLAPLEHALTQINEAVEARDLPALVQARQAFFELPAESIDNDFTGNLLRGLSGSARRLMVQASRNPDFDAADTKRCAQSLYDATADHDGERVRQIMTAMLRRDATLASASS